MDRGSFPSSDRTRAVPGGEYAFGELTQRMLQHGSLGARRIDFLQETSALILEASGCDALEIRLSDRDLYYRWQSEGSRDSGRFEVLDPPDPSAVTDGSPSALSLDALCAAVLADELDTRSEHVTPHGSFWTGDLRQTTHVVTDRGRTAIEFGESAQAPYPSLAIIPFPVGTDLTGLLLLKSIRRNFMHLQRVKDFETVAGFFGLAVANRRAEAALRERVKEITCLYGLALLTDRPELATPDLLLAASELLPPAWQYPELACAQIIFDGREYTTRRFGAAIHAQRAPIFIDGRQRGTVEVRYFRDSPEFGSQPFLDEERHLIDAVASQLSMALERRHTAHQRLQLEAQLRHADRLATIGQLAAGVAHELNEPLGNVLGLAQLMAKSADLPESGRNDLDRIIQAALHAREIIRSLMLFSRQTPPKKVLSDLNQLMEESLSFVEARCAKLGVALEMNLAPDLPRIEVDPVQIRQVVVNLAVNALQAMPGGGTLKVATRPHGSHVIFSVKDSGTGMTEHVKRKLFMPFFTTKEGHEGTGLGLSVTHGIVTAHGGSIHFESAVGKGTEFMVHLPVKSAAWEDSRERA